MTAGQITRGAQLYRLTRLNVILQIENLRTHLFVQAALARQALQIHGWVYDIETGAVKTDNPDAGAFQEFPWALESTPM